MNNQDMPANVIIDKTGHALRKDGVKCEGETKREKAFWMIYNTMLSHPASIANGSTNDTCAKHAISAVNAGFKALESE